MGAKRVGPRRPRREPVRDPAERRVDLHFHYNRGDRLSLPGSPNRAPREGFFRRYRGTLIILADIAVLLILGFAFLRLFGPPDDSARIGPYRATLRGLEYGQAIFATVAVRMDGGASPAGEARVFARFSLVRNPADSEAQFDSAPVPLEVGEEVVLKVGLPLDGSPRRVYAEVRIGARSTRLSFALDS